MTELTLDAKGIAHLDDRSALKHDPFFKGQIGEPTDEFIAPFRRLYRPLIDGSALDTDHLRILEVGAGIGRMTNALIKEYQPDLIVATEPFPSLVDRLRAHLDDWGYSAPRGVAALYNGDAALKAPQNHFNLIIGNSVLHHVLDYDVSLEDWASKLASPGMIVFGEPIKEGWLYWTTLVKSVILAHEARKLKLSRRGISTFRRHHAVMELRLGNDDNRQRLKDEDDKYMFSPLTMLDIASKLDLRLKILKPKRDFKNQMRERMRRIGISDKDADAATAYMVPLLPAGLDGSAMSDFMAVFAFTKD